MNQVWPVFWGHLLCSVSLWYSHVYNPSLIIGMYQFISASPFPVRGIFLGSPSVHPAHQTGYWDPEEKGNEDDGTDNIVLEELENGANADVIYEVPDSDNVLISLFTMAFVTESLETRRAVWQNVHGRNSITRTVKVSSTTTLTGICTAITHARLLSLSFTKWNALSLFALSFLNAVCSICHVS